MVLRASLTHRRLTELCLLIEGFCAVMLVAGVRVLMFLEAAEFRAFRSPNLSVSSRCLYSLICCFTFRRPRGKCDTSGPQTTHFIMVQSRGIIDVSEERHGRHSTEYLINIGSEAGRRSGPRGRKRS